MYRRDSYNNQRNHNHRHSRGHYDSSPRRGVAENLENPHEVGFSDAVTGMLQMVRKETSRSGRARARLRGDHFTLHNPTYQPHYQDLLTDSEISQSTPDRELDSLFLPRGSMHPRPSSLEPFHQLPARFVHSRRNPTRCHEETLRRDLERKY